MEIIPVIVIAFLIAVLFSMLGLGGAIIYTPLFFWLGIPLLDAIPMALLLNAITTSSASITYLRENLVNKKIACPMILTTVAGALIGSYLVYKVETKLIIFLLSVILFIAALRILLFSNIGFTIKQGGDTKVLIGGICAFIIGIIASFVGIGGGTFVVPLLLILGLETKNAVATSAFIITFTSISGFAGHLGFGMQDLDIPVMFYAGVAAFTGAQVGSRMIFRHISPGGISRLFAFVLLLVAGKLLYGLM